jgi:hypothetical protein
MENSKNKYDFKYKFDLTEELNTCNKNIVLNNQSIDLPIEKEIKKKENKLKVEIKINNPEDIKKITIDHKTYYENLKRKIILNHKLFTLFTENFYRDEFNGSRTSSYLMFAIPMGVIMFFRIVSPYHPLLGIALNISLLGTISSFCYYFNRDIIRIGQMDYTELGRKVKLIKNEIALYNPLAQPIKEEDETNENKNI